jgi:hypothetical protein
MNWFYTDNNEQRGPVSESEFDFLVRAGKIKPDTLVWREGMAGWQPWSEVAPPPAADAVPTPVGGALQASGAPLDSAGRNGPSWEQRETLGFLHAAVETVKEVLQNPSDTFSRMKREGGLSSPLLYALLLGCVGSYIGVIYSFVLNHLGIGSQSYNLAGSTAHATQQQLFIQQQLNFTAVGHGASLVVVLLFLPVFMAIGTFVNSAIIHVCLMLLGGAKQPYETTYRVLCYSTGSASILQVIPFCGGLISVVWNLFATCIGIARAHEIPTGKAVAAVLLPLAVCCASMIALLVFIGSLAAFASHR